MLRRLLIVAVLALGTLGAVGSVAPAHAWVRPPVLGLARRLVGFSGLALVGRPGLDSRPRLGPAPTRRVAYGTPPCGKGCCSISRMRPLIAP